MLKKILWVIGGIILLPFVLAAFLGDSSDNGSEGKEIAQIAPASQSSVVFDLNSVYAKDIDEVINIFGNPKFDTEPTDLQIRMGTKEWEKTFEREGYELLVTYYVDSRKVKDFFLSTKEASGITKDTDSLEKALGLNNSDFFMVDPVESLRDKGEYTGVIATPKP